MQSPKEPAPIKISQWLLNGATVCIIGLFLRHWLSVATDYPYYFIWDMDLVFAQDSLLLHDGELPDYFGHPSFGVYFFLFFSQKIAYAMDVISVLSLDDLSASLNPITSMAEYTDYIRAQSPYIVLAIVLLQWGALVILFRLNAGWRLITLCVLGLQEALLYHVALARSSLYSVFYWSIALFLITLTMRAQKQTRFRVFLLFLAGLALGLACLTKVQALFYLLAAPFLLYFIQSRRTSDNSPELPSARNARNITLSIAASTLCFLALLAIARRSVFPEVEQQWGAQVGVSSIYVLSGLALLGIVSWQFVMLSRKNFHSSFFLYSTPVALFLPGFLAAFLLHFLLFTNPGTAWDMLLRDAKIVFGFPTHRPLNSPSPDWLTSLKEITKYIFPAVAIHIAAFGLFAWTTLKAKDNPQARASLLFASVLSSLAFLSMVPGARLVLRDLIWIETLLTVLSLIYILSAVALNLRPNRAVKAVAVSLALSLIVVHGVRSAEMPTRIDLNYNNYGWQDDPWFVAMYPGNQARYGDLMQTRYGDDKEVAKRQAARHREIRRAVDYVFTNQRVTHRNIGVVADGFPVWTNDLEWKITSFPESLSEAALVDNVPLKIYSRFSMIPENVYGTSENMNKINRNPAPDRIAMLARPDLRVLIFGDQADIEKLTGDHATLSDETIVVSNGTESRELHALEIWSYGEIPLSEMSKPFISVVQFRVPKMYFPYRLYVESTPRTHIP